MEYKYRYIYQIRCTNGSFKDHVYFGKHTTNDLDDGYKGSGTLLKKYYKKYPNDFEKDIICFANSEDELNKLEKNIIDYYYTHLPNLCLNIHPGGNGGKYFQTEDTKKKLSMMRKGKHLSDEQKRKISEAQKGKPMYKLRGRPSWNKGIPCKEETKQKLRDIQTGKYVGEKNPMYGKHHTEETKNKISDKLKGNVPVNKGKKESEAFRQKLRDAWVLRKIKIQNNKT